MAQQANISPEMSTLLKIAARCRLNILISGGTGSGKTTLLNALSRLIDPTERTVTIEDAAELQLQQPHVVRLETRPPNLEGSGEITMRDLLRNALRMRPDRIILGEIRGAEALDVLQAMNTGHDGSMGTIHANRPREALTRLENMVGMTGINLPSHAVRTQIAAAVNLILQVNRMRDGVRRVTDVIEVVGMEGDISLDATLLRVARELAASWPELAEEFALTAALPDRRLAFENLNNRTDSDAIRAVVNTLQQTAKFGTPLAHSLRILANESRAARMTRAEEKAARLPAMLTVPMILFILPTLFIVLLGPAAINIMDTFNKP
jgi:energy-coupling factor transporter ATP-binding protein EcfA2